MVSAPQPFSSTSSPWRTAGSSSTSTSRRPCSVSASGPLAGNALAATLGARPSGSSSVKTLPRPGCERSVSEAFISSANRLTIASPRPSPLRCSGDSDTLLGT